MMRLTTLFLLLVSYVVSCLGTPPVGIQCQPELKAHGLSAFTGQIKIISDGYKIKSKSEADWDRLFAWTGLAFQDMKRAMNQQKINRDSRPSIMIGVHDLGTDKIIFGSSVKGKSGLEGLKWLATLSKHYGHHAAYNALDQAYKECFKEFGDTDHRTNGACGEFIVMLQYAVENNSMPHHHSNIMIVAVRCSGEICRAIPPCTVGSETNVAAQTGGRDSQWGCLDYQNFHGIGVAPMREDKLSPLNPAPIEHVDYQILPQIPLVMKPTDQGASDLIGQSKVSAGVPSAAAQAKSGTTSKLPPNDKNASREKAVPGPSRRPSRLRRSSSSIRTPK